MHDADNDLGFGPGSRSAPQMAQPPPPLVSLNSFRRMPSPSSRRLSSSFTRPSEPVSRRNLAWVSLEGRLVNAEEASSARAVKGLLSREEAVSWELFTPLQRFLIVAVIGVAAAESKKNRLISQLTKSVEFRDQVLLRMQQKLDNLCEQFYYVKDQKGIIANTSVNGNAESAQSETFGSDKINFVDCGCWLCDQHHNQLTGLTGCSAKNSSGDEMMQYKMTHGIEAEQEERRMSALSDWASSSGMSTTEIQMNNFSIEQDICDLKECEEKDATIKELTNLFQSTNVTGSKRILELEDIICRKNSTITRLKKDMVVLEQKVVQLTRQHRSSSSASTLALASDSNYWQLPVMTSNLVYDMDSTTSPSSSDSDSPTKNLPVASERPVASDRPVATDRQVAIDRPVVSVAKFQETPLRSPAAKFQDSPPQSHIAKFQDTPLRRGDFASTSRPKSASPKISSSLLKPIGRPKKPMSVSPLRETPLNQKFRTVSTLRQKQSLVRGEFKKARRRSLTASMDAAPPKRWT